MSNDSKDYVVLNKKYKNCVFLNLSRSLLPRRSVNIYFLPLAWEPAADIWVKETKKRRILSHLQNHLLSLSIKGLEVWEEALLSLLFWLLVSWVWQRSRKKNFFPTTLKIVSFYPSQKIMSKRRIYESYAVQEYGKSFFVCGRVSSLGCWPAWKLSTKASTPKC